MTSIRYKSKPVWHQTGLLDRSSGRAICVAESPAALLIRLKGTRTTVQLPWNLCYLHGAFALANANRVAKKSRKSVRRGALAMGGGR